VVRCPRLSRRRRRRPIRWRRSSTSSSSSKRTGRSIICFNGISRCGNRAEREDEHRADGATPLAKTGSRRRHQPRAHQIGGSNTRTVTCILTWARRRASRRAIPTPILRIGNGAVLGVSAELCLGRSNVPVEHRTEFRCTPIPDRRLVAIRSEPVRRREPRSQYHLGLRRSEHVTVGQLGPNGTSLPGPYPCFDYTTLGDEFDREAISWRYYAPSITGTGGSILVGLRCDPSHPISAPIGQTTSSRRNADSDRRSNGTLATVTWVVPSGGNSDHCCGSQNGPAWVASVVNAIGQSKFWNSTQFS